MATIRCRDTTFHNIQAVLFDKDGTLANSETVLRNLAQRRSRLIDAQVPGVQDPLLMAFGVDNHQIDPAGLMAVGSRLENEIAAAAYVAETGRGWIESLHLVRAAFVEADQNRQPKAEQTPLVTGALDLLQNLARLNIRMGILSSDRTDQVQAFVQQYNLAPYIHCSLGVEGYPDKSAPELLQQVWNCLEIPAAQTILIGDAHLDITIARTEGMAGCIGFTGGWSRPVQLEQADTIAASFEEIEVLP